MLSISVMPALTSTVVQQTLCLWMALSVWMTVTWNKKTTHYLDPLKWTQSSNLQDVHLSLLSIFIVLIVPVSWNFLFICFGVRPSKVWYSQTWTLLYRHPLKTDTSLLRSVYFVPFDLFSFCVLFSQNRSCDNTLENCSSLACENIRFSSLFAAGDVSRGGTSATQR